MLSLDDTVQRAPGVVSRESGDELVAVLPEQGRFLVLNDTGAQIWEMADGQHTLRDIALALVETWQIEPARAEADVLRLASQLIERGALVG
ncbi:PqqD family protein [Chloroflexota bacterium]